MRPSIYLDNSATTRVRDEVREAMAPYQSEMWGNASSLHAHGRGARLAVELARQQVAELIGARAREVLFSPNATASNNAAILGRARFVEENNLGRHIITTPIEHSSVLGPVKHLEARGWRVTQLKVDDQGFVDMNDLVDAIDADTSIISIIWANNEIGTVQPIDSIGAIARERNIFFHCDAVQVPGKLQIDIAQLGVDSLSLSGHKFYGPKGIGVLYVREGVEILPISFGGGQERGFFPGTENVENIVGIGKAAELCKRELPATNEHLKGLQRLLISELMRYPNVRLTGPSDPERRLPGHVSVVVKGCVGADLVIDADVNGVCISSASACSSASDEISHVLKAIKVPREDAHGCLRISAGRFNTEQECLIAASIINDIISSQWSGLAEDLSAQQAKPVLIG